MAIPGAAIAAAGSILQAIVAIHDGHRAEVMWGFEQARLLLGPGASVTAVQLATLDILGFIDDTVAARHPQLPPPQPGNPGGFQDS